MAEARCADFILIMLFCNEQTNMQDLVFSERELHSKLMDVELMNNSCLEGDVYRFKGHPNYLELDVSDLSPEEAARQICEHLRVGCPEL